MTVTSYIGIGSNLGNRGQNIRKAIKLLGDSGRIKIEGTSSIYETEPVGGPDGQNKFLNGVIRVKTSLEPYALLGRLQDIEIRVKRRKDVVKNGPRTIDLDVLTYGRRVIRERDLVVPHPQLEARNFVLKGFCQIAPDFMHPVLKKRVKELYAGIGGKG